MRQLVPHTLLLASATILLGACAGPIPPRTFSGATTSGPYAAVVHGQTIERTQLAYVLPTGRHDCEFGKHIRLQRDPGNASHLDLEWQGERYQMTRHRSTSGLPRYEHLGSGLVWIELPWKGMLLDGRSGRPLANECRPV